MIDKSKTYDSEAFILDESRYELKITLYSTAKLLNYVLKKSKNALLKKRGIKVDDKSIDHIKKFDVPPEYLKMIKVALSKKADRRGSIMRIESDNFKSAGKVMLSHHVEKATFIKSKDYWNIECFVGGMYANKN